MSRERECKVPLPATVQPRSEGRERGWAGGVMFAAWDGTICNRRQSRKRGERRSAFQKGIEMRGQRKRRE
eukprot:2086768-Rhodomonas_salina.1